MQSSVVMCQNIHISFSIQYRIHFRELKDKLLRYDNDQLVMGKRRKILELSFEMESLFVWNMLIHVDINGHETYLSWKNSILCHK